MQKVRQLRPGAVKSPAHRYTAGNCETGIGIQASNFRIYAFDAAAGCLSPTYNPQICYTHGKPRPQMKVQIAEVGNIVFINSQKLLLSIPLVLVIT